MVHYSSFARHVFLLLYTYMENKNIVPNFYLNKALVQSRLGVRLPKSGFARICLFPTFWRGLSRVCHFILYMRKLLTVLLTGPRVVLLLVDSFLGLWARYFNRIH